MNRPHSNRLSRSRIAVTDRNDPSTSKTRDFADIKAAARHQWPSLLTRFGVANEALSNHHGPCPGCGGVDRFRFDDQDGHGTFICSNGGGDPVAGDGFGLLEHIYHWTTKEVFQEVADALGIACDKESPPRPSRQRPVKCSVKVLAPEERQRRKDKLNAVWRASYPLDHPQAEPARVYFAARGLAELRCDLPCDVRLHPKLTYWQPIGNGHYETVGDFPALVALVRDAQGQPISLHRTWLTGCGNQKAEVPEPKKLMTGVTSITGGAIRLYPADHRLAIVEGIETALSIRVALPDWPVWSAINSGNMKKLLLPPAITEVLICADHDPAGIEAANRLADRLAYDKTVRMILPAQGDFNDVLKGV